MKGQFCIILSSLLVAPFCLFFAYIDLTLGDVHLIPIDDLMSREEGKDLVGVVSWGHVTLVGLGYHHPCSWH